MVGILRCGKMLPQLNLVIEIGLRTPPLRCSSSAGAHPGGGTLSTNFEIQNVRVHKTHGRVCDLLGQRRGRGSHRRGEAGQPPGVADAAGQPAVPTEPHEGSLGALPLPLRPRGHLRRHGAQHRHRPRGLPAPQLHCRLSHQARAQMPLSGVSTRLGDLARALASALPRMAAPRAAVVTASRRAAAILESTSEKVSTADCRA